MKYTVTYACGHDGVVNLFGKAAERERKLAWLATCDCVDCRRAKQMDAAAAAEAKYNLPALTGTEKQVAWARKIRFDRVTEFENILSKAVSGQEEAEKKVMSWLRSKTNATFFIDTLTLTDIRFFRAHSKEWNV